MHMHVINVWMSKVNSYMHVCKLHSAHCLQDKVSVVTWMLVGVRSSAATLPAAYFTSSTIQVSRHTLSSSVWSELVKCYNENNFSIRLHLKT